MRIDHESFQESIFLNAMTRCHGRPRTFDDFFDIITAYDASRKRDRVPAGGYDDSDQFSEGSLFPVAITYCQHLETRITLHFW